MERDEEFFLECKGIKFLCEFIRKNYPKEYAMCWIRNVCDVLRDCNKNVPD